MALIDILARAQDGRLYENIAKGLDLDSAETRAAMERLCPAIAEKLKSKAQDDSELFASLLDLIDDNGEGSPLDDDERLTGAEGLSDGNTVLADVYGSRNAAIVEMRKLAGDVPETALAKLSAISATAVVAALAQVNGPMALSGALPAAGGGLFGTIVAAVIKGAVQGVTRQLAPRRRRRSYSTYWGPRRRKRPTRRRRSTSVSIEDIFGELLGARRK